MRLAVPRSPIALAAAAAAALGALALTGVSRPAAAAKTAGTYAAGDFHNHTTCSDGSISMQKLVKKATDKVETPWGLDWFVQAGHGGSGTRNCTLAEDASLAAPAYPLVAKDGVVQGPTTTWQGSTPPITPKGTVSGSAPKQAMWRWQSLQEFQYPLLEYLARYKDKPLFLGLESVVAGHEHGSVSIVAGQMPAAMDGKPLRTAPGYKAVGHANALAQWSYCFDRGDVDLSRGAGNAWDCAVTGSLNAADPHWNATAQKLMQPAAAAGSGAGTIGHHKTLEALKWMKEHHPLTSYYVPSHLERPGPFNPDGNNGYNVEHLRDFNNAAPSVAFGFETQPGHGAAAERGEYRQGRNNINGVPVDSVGGTTWGGTGVYGAQIGGVWDALLGEGRNWWFFANSDWHNRGSFGPDDRRSTQDFFPGEYQRTYVLVRNGGDKLRPRTIVDGLRSGNAFSATGQLIDRLAFVACSAASHKRAGVEALALAAARANTDPSAAGCATLGEKLKVKPGTDVLLAVVVRDPAGPNHAPYTFDNPSLAQVGIRQPLNAPVLDHVDLIRGLVTGYKVPGSADYAGAWPGTWLNNPSLDTVPAAARNPTALLLRTFSAATWTAVAGEPAYKVMSLRLPGVKSSQYLRLRGSNLPPSVPFETDANGNPLPDVHTNAVVPANLRIPCKAAGTRVPSAGETYTGADIDGCPAHLPVLNEQKYVAYDVAAWSDLWFYSNPIYVEVQGATAVAGVK